MNKPTKQDVMAAKRICASIEREDGVAIGDDWIAVIIYDCMFHERELLRELAVFCRCTNTLDGAMLADKAKEMLKEQEA